MTVLVAGVGNMFLGDDGFGVEVAHRLTCRDLPNGVTVADYGIRGMHLAYDLAGSDHDLVIMVDAASTGEPPGTVSVVELDPAAAPSAEVMDAHGMQPDVVLGLVGVLGGSLRRVLLVGCEPATLDEGIGLSPVVAQAVEPAVEAVLEILSERRERPCALASQEK